MSTAAKTHLLLARREALYALKALGQDEEYLRDELERHLESVQLLIGKMEREEALIRDRDLLQADFSDAGLGEWIGDRNDNE